MTPKHRLRQQQHIAAGKEDGLIRGCRVRNISARGAPVFAVEIGDGEFQDLQWPQRGSLKRVKKTSQMTQLVALPKETLTNVERMDGGMIAKRFGEQNGAVQPAADEDSKGRASG